MPICPPQKNAWMRKGAASAHRNTAIAACRRFGRKLWKSWSGYHQRSLVETKMRCIKRFGERACLEPSSAKSTNCTSEPPFSIGLLNGCPQMVAVA